MVRKSLGLFILLSGLLAGCELIASVDRSRIAEGDGGPTDDSSVGRCGDGVVQGDEMCDGEDLNDETCASATMDAMNGGTLSCTSSCKFDVRKCDDNVADGSMDDGGGGAGG
jgi:hypothetical protein